MNEHTDREAMLREIAKKRVVYQLPGMDALRVRRDLTYRSTSGAGLLMGSLLPVGVVTSASAGHSSPWRIPIRRLASASTDLSRRGHS